MFPDLLHPAAKGYHVWYDGILPTIRELVGKKKQDFTQLPNLG